MRIDESKSGDRKRVATYLVMVGRILTATVLVAAVALAPAEAGIKSTPLRFAKGASSATVNGTLKGDETLDYTLGAKAGQTMHVTLKTSNGANYFNVLPPGSKDVAIFVGSTSGNEWTGELPASGVYTIRVYLMRSAARRNEKASYVLNVGITGSATATGLGKAPASDARVPGTRYHATGTVPCSRGNAPADAMQCDFGVIRGTPGNADVHVTAPGGSERVLIFRGSQVSTKTGTKVNATNRAGLWSVDVDDEEHYQIPESVISGG